MTIASDSGEDFLAALAPQEAAALREIGRSRRHRAGEVLFREGDLADAVLVVLAGRIKLHGVTETGREAILAIRGPGDLIGEMSAIDGAPRSATATAFEPVEVLAVAPSAFLGFLARTPGVAVVVLRTVIARLREADRGRVEFVAQDTAGRVCARLVELGERFGRPGEQGVDIDLAISQEELAGWTGSSREAVIKALRALRDLGWVATRRRGLTLLDVEALRRRAGG